MKDAATINMECACMMSITLPPSKLPEMIRADGRVAVMKPHVVYAGRELNHVIDIRLIFNRPVHTATNATKWKSSFGGSAGQFLKEFRHLILIEAPIGKVKPRCALPPRRCLR